MDFLVVEGNIGSGKTTLTQMIARDYNAQTVLERFADNPFLEKFYNDKQQYAFPLEMSFMAERYSQLMNELQQRNLFTDFAVADYYFMKSLIFAGVTLAPDEYNLYRKFFEIIYSRMPRPDLYVYLHKSPENLLRQIRKRGRDYELLIDGSYLESISQAYFNYFKQQNEFPVVIIDTNGIDFVANESDYRRLCQVILNTKYEKGISRVIL
jgi:deoxyguanosine kinase